MLSPTSQTAWDRQSRSSSPPSLSLFIYLSQLSSMLSPTLIYLLPFLSHSLNLSAHSLALRHLQFFLPFFFIWISQSRTFPLLFIIHQLINPSFFITFLPHGWKWKWFSTKMYRAVSPSCFFTQRCIFDTILKIQRGKRVSKTKQKNKPEARIKVRPITDGVLLFQKYYPYTSAARGRLIGCQKQTIPVKISYSKNSKHLSVCLKCQVCW